MPARTRYACERRRVRARAFTLVEVLAAMTIVGLLMGLAVPQFTEFVERARVVKAIGDLRALVVEIASADSIPASLAGIGRDGMLDPWGRPYVFMKFPPVKGGGHPKGARKDRFLVPINSEYDLYSSGKDGASHAALTPKVSQDDVIVANDGGFVGLAKNY